MFCYLSNIQQVLLLKYDTLHHKKLHCCLYKQLVVNYYSSCNAVTFFGMYYLISGTGSVVGIATAYGLEGPGIESRWGEIFRTSPDRP